MGSKIKTYDYSISYSLFMMGVKMDRILFISGFMMNGKHVSYQGSLAPTNLGSLHITSILLRTLKLYQKTLQQRDRTFLYKLFLYM